MGGGGAGGVAALARFLGRGGSAARPLAAQRGEGELREPVGGGAAAGLRKKHDGLWWSCGAAGVLACFLGDGGGAAWRLVRVGSPAVEGDRQRDLRFWVAVVC